MDDINRSSGKYRMTLQFNTSDEGQRQCLNFLSICGYKKNQILSIMVQEFIETYGFDIEEMTGEDIKKFIKSYPYIKKMKGQNHYIPLPVQQYTTPEEPDKILEPKDEKQKEKRQTRTEDKNPEILSTGLSDDFEIDNAKADQALAAFGL